ncbi:MAG: PQQ-dependent sugar dehydrogenase [Anaerolineae bacterium]
MKFRSLALLALIIGLAAFISACSSTPDEGSVTPEVIAEIAEPILDPTDTPTELPPVVIEVPEEDDSDLLSDLMIETVTVSPAPGVTCLDENFALASSIWISNIGSIPAGPFDVFVNGETLSFEGELFPGDRKELQVGGYDSSPDILVDPNNQIPESNEDNNAFAQQLPELTPPPRCTPTAEPAPAAAPVNAIELEWVAGGFAKPLLVTHAGDERLFVVEQQGTIRVMAADGTVGNVPFLNMIDRTNSGRNEQGLLGLTFHPNYQQNGRFFVNYTHADGSTVVSEFNVTSDPDLADPNSERQLIKIEQPYANHNGGMIEFGPDGYLYIGMGDGGSQNDPENRAQNLNSLLGKILRIDVDSAQPYGIPADNPFVNDDNARNEIWSYGWRNPWRFSFDSATGDMLVADVGQNQIEEISLNSAGVGGLNFGWRIFEGNECNLDDCSTGELQPAIAQYNHVDGHCSVTGGYMHRGSENPSLYGNYFFADYCSSQMWRLFPNADGSYNMAMLSRPGFFISSFGEDVNGEIYLTNQVGGEVYKIVPAQ